MRHALCLISHNRPDMLDLTLQYVDKLKGRDKVDVFIYQDGPRIEFKQKVREAMSYGSITMHQTKQCLGLSKNILWCLQDMFEKQGYQLVTILEDDVLLSSDFVEWVQESAFLGGPEIFTISGFGNVGHENKHRVDPSWNAITDWYFTGAVTFRLADYALVKQHICPEFFEHAPGYMHKHLGDSCKKASPEFYNFQFTGPDKVRWPLQAGLINCIRVAHKKKQITPIVSRCQNIGYYGFNQPNKQPDGSDVTDPENWKKGLYYNPTWQEHYEWEKLVIVDAAHFPELRSTKPWTVAQC